MKFRNLAQESRPAEMQLAPMIDVVFLLLIFFLMTWTYSRETELDISVPAADESREPDRRFGEQIINVDAEGKIILNSFEVTEDDLLSRLRAVAELRPDQSVILRGDAKAAYEDIVRVLNVCHKARIYNVAFASKKPEP